MLTRKRHNELWTNLGYTGFFEYNENPPQHEIDEINQRIAAVRSGWSSAQKKERLVGNGGRVPWSLPVYYTTYVPAEPGRSSNRHNKRIKVYKPLESH